MKSRLGWCWLVCVSVLVVAGHAWAMRLTDESVTKAKTGIVANPTEVYDAIRAAPADYAAWQARNANPVGKPKLQQPVAATKTAALQAPTPASSLTSLVPDLKVRYDAKTGAACFIRSKNLDAAGAGQVGKLMAPSTGASTPLARVRPYQGMLKIRNVDQEFTPKYTHADRLGLTHYKYQQTYKGVPIWAKELWVHTDSKGDTYLIEGKVQPTPSIDVQPKLTSDRAIQVAQQDMPGVTGPTAALMIYVDDVSVPHLAWYVTATQSYNRWHWFIDAQDGTVLHKFNDTRYDAVAGSGADLSGATDDFSTWYQGSTYYMIDTTLPMHGANPNPPNSLGSGNLVVFDAKNQDPNSNITGYFLEASAPDSGWDTAGVSAMDNLRTVTNYYKNTFGRNGIDNKTLNTISFVHVGQSWDNACWTGQVILIGDGGQHFVRLAGGLDVLAHEYTHAVIDYTASFEYQYQSGALHEGIADIFGCMVDRSNWTVGETITRSGQPLRDLANPHNDMDGPDPATMDEYRNVPYSNDYGGVHLNATIIGHAAYLMADGLADAIGRDKTAQVFYRAITTHMTSQSNFVDCRNATVQSAEELYGADSREVQAVTDAWDAVKVGSSGGTGTGGGTGGSVPPATGPDSLVFVYYNGSSAYLGMRTSTGDAYQVSPTPVSAVRPVITTGGTEVLFVDANNNLRVASLNPNDTYENVVIGDGTIRTIGGSRDGRYFAYSDMS